MRTALYCASLIVVASCVSAKAQSYVGRPHGDEVTIACTERGCATTAAASQPRRVGAARRVLLRRPGSLRTYSLRYARRHMLEASPRRARAIIVSHRHTGAGVVTIQTAANPITVSSRIAGQMRALIADLVAHGFRGHITCQASGHMPHSLHHTGEACDFAQLHRNVVASGARIMYRARALIAAHGLRDGCSFHDCGHVDSGRMNFHARAQWTPGHVAHIRRYAQQRYSGQRFYRTATRRHWH